MQSYLKKILLKETLTLQEAQNAMAILAHPETDKIQSAAFLATLHFRGETQEELLGFIKFLRSRCVVDMISDDIIVDTSGTGGDHANTFNISTAAGLLASSVGVKIAKHSGRAVSSRCGSADVLQALNINIPRNHNEIAEHLTQNFVFLQAANFNPVLKQVAIIRKHLQIRTCFNILGPLLHPLKIKHHVLGVYNQALLMPMAQILQRLGVVAAMVVNARDGLDEISVNAMTDVIYLQQNELHHLTINPRNYGLSKVPHHELQGGDAKTNAAMIERLFQNENDLRREIVMLNCAAILLVSGQVLNLSDGLARAEESLRSGQALAYLRRLQSFHSERQYA